jgi:hypothetical protein
MRMNALPSGGGVLDQNAILMKQFMVLLRVQGEKAEWDRKIEESRQRASR